MAKPDIEIRRIYEDQGQSTGARVLVDRVWPRGISKADAALDHWCKEIAPTTELRKWFDHDPKRWAAFKKKYRKELKEDGQHEQLEELAAMACSGGLVLLYGAQDTEHNQAVVLGEVIEELCKVES